MKLSAFALGLTLAAMWGGVILLVGIMGMAAPGYGAPLLFFASSMYPGYENAGTFLDLIVGVLYSIVDGFVGGLIFAWLYNAFAKLTGGKEAAEPAARS